VESDPAAEHDVEVEWPSGYSLDEAGLWFGDNEAPEWISGPFKILGEARNSASTGWGVALEWCDRDDVPHCTVVSRSDLIGGSDVMRTLVDGGLQLSTKPSNLGRFREALNGVRCSGRVRLVDKTGWYGEAFVLPDRVIGPYSPERLHYAGGRSGARFANAGTLDDWARGVASRASGNPRLLLAISTAFSGPLFDMLDERPIGIHFRGGSSTGKTTLLTAAGSIWGGGSPNGFCGSWRATANGLEATAVAHSGTCLVLDELAEIDAQEAGKAAYALINGIGKQRAAQSGAARRRFEWCTPVLSSGEISLADKIAEDRGRPARVGVEVRLADLEADAGKALGVFEELHGSSSAADFADTLRQAALRSYGTAGPAFVEMLAANFEEAKSGATQAVDEIVSKMTAGVSEGQLLRVARRFAIIGVAGELARAALGLPWQPDESIDAAVRLFMEWKASRGDCSGEVTRALQAIRIAIDRHGPSRFEDRRQNHSASAVVRDRLGFRCWIQNTECWAFTKDGWQEVVGRVADPTVIGRHLKARGWVLTDTAGKWQVPYKVDGHSTRVIAIPAENLEKFDALQ
jgi:putative DNA primase/helicase